MKSSVMTVATVFALSLSPALATAGELQKTEARCTPAGPDNSSSCQGTMDSFRQSKDPQSFAALRLRLNGVMYFEAFSNGVYFSCFFPDTYDSQYFASFVGDLQHAKFVIGQKNGYCDVMSSVERGTAFPEY